MSHTPGPWRISDFERRTGGISRVVMGADDFSVAHLDGRTVVEHEANARLIAAAPELLEAVKDALAFLDRPDITTYEWYKLAPEHVGMFRRALAKAGA